MRSANNVLPRFLPSLEILSLDALGRLGLRRALLCFLCLLWWSSAHQGGAQAQEIDHPFHNAIRLQDFVEAERLLDERGGALLTETDSFGMLPLHSAASLGSMEAIEFLIDQGTDVRYIPQGGFSPLVRGRSPLHLAVATGNTQVIDLFVDAGVDVFAQDNNGITPLHLAVQYGRIRVATRLIEIKGERAHIRDKNGTTSLHLASRHGREIIITKLLFLGDLEKIALSKRLKKLLSSESGLSKEIARRWRAGLVNTQNNFGLSSLHYASLGGHEEAVELLLEHGAKLNITSKQGLTPLFVAARAGRTEIVEILSELNGINLEGGDALAHSPLSIAVMNGHLRIVVRLLQSGADPHAKNNDGMLPLHIAAQRGHGEVVVALLRVLKKRKGNIDERDKLGNTPLHYATKTGRKELVRELLQAGANSSLRNRKNETAQDIAEERGDDEVLSVLR